MIIVKILVSPKLLWMLEDSEGSKQLRTLRLIYWFKHLLKYTKRKKYRTSRRELSSQKVNFLSNYRITSLSSHSNKHLIPKPLVILLDIFRCYWQELLSHSLWLPLTLTDSLLLLPAHGLTSRLLLQPLCGIFLQNALIWAGLSVLPKLVVFTLSDSFH